MSKNVLITGGAGFIGQKLVRALLDQDYKVKVLDNFSSQVHGQDSWPAEFCGRVELIRADIRNRADLKRALNSAEILVHFAAETGTGQSMYEINHYFDVNVQATATMLEILQGGDCGDSLRSIIVASSRAVYGEGAYLCNKHGIVYPRQRERDKMEAAIFEPVCPSCSNRVSLMATPESAPFNPMSFYGLTKQVQEQAVLLFGNINGINAFALRYQNVYGPGQSLKNPYTGILAVFSNLARQNQLIEIYEDGEESRDFVYVDDVVEATIRCINFKGKFVGSLNVGSGKATSVMTVAKEIRNYFGSNSPIEITGRFRVGDIRHNIADISKLQELLGFTPTISFSEGLYRFMDWAAQNPAEDKGAYVRSVSELSSKGLMGSVK